MASLEETLSETINEIISAFKGVSREGGVSLHETRVLDDQGSDAERAEARAKDTDVNWQDVPDSHIEKPDLSLIFLDPIGFRYYIPAYMIWELKQFSKNEWVDCNNSGDALSALAGLTTDKSQYALFTQEQARAICKFLQFYAVHGDEFERREAQEALDWYWGRRA